MRTRHAAPAEWESSKPKAAGATGRLTQYQDIQNKIMADAPWVPLRHQVWYTLVSNHVGTFYLHPVWLYDLRGYSVKPG